jgi:uncharacterized protein YbjT (DUF2867 family)
MTNATKHTILVIGSTGKTGSRVADQLEKRGIVVRHGSRTADIPFDWDNPQSWAPALAGVDAVYLTYYPDLAVPGSVDAVRGVTELAERAGVRRLVLLSGRNEAEARRAEDVVKASSLQWTIVRCAFFAQNFSEGAWLDEILAGRVALPVRDVKEPFVDADDIAFVSVSIDDYTAMLAEYGLPQDFIWLLNQLFTEVLGSKAELSDGVRRALGREPKDFADYAHAAAASGVWTPQGSP